MIGPQEWWSNVTNAFQEVKQMQKDKTPNAVKEILKNQLHTEEARVKQFTNLKWERPAEEKDPEQIVKESKRSISKLRCQLAANFILGIIHPFTKKSE